MDLKNLGELNTERFLRKAFDTTCRESLLRAARLLRNTCPTLFLAGFLCIFIAGISRFPLKT